MSGSAGSASDTISPEAAAGVGAVSGSPDSRSLDASKLQEENQKLTSQVLNAQKLIGSMTQELGSLRKLKQQVNARTQEDEFVMEQPVEDVEDIRSSIAEIRDTQDILRYREENPDWREFAPKVAGILKDEGEAARVVATRKDGKIDWYRTLSAAKDRAELLEMKQMKAKGQEKRQEASREREIVNGRAAISGDGGSGGGGVPEGEVSMAEVAQLLDSDPQKLVEMGLLKVNRADPPLFMTRRAQRSKEK